MLNAFNSIYLDFDGTVTKNDTVWSFIGTFAGKEWEEIEKQWIKGEINSRVCMQKQLDLIKNLTEEDFDDFINSIEIQDGFKEFCEFAEKNNKKITILSDGFDIFIKRTLEKENINNITFFSNKLEVSKNNGYLRFKLTFPYKDENCRLNLGMCKCSKIQKDEKFLYTGDGLSDRCIASKSNLLFAKNSLKNHCLENNIKFTEFKDFFQILNCIKEGDIKCRA